MGCFSLVLKKTIAAGVNQLAAQNSCEDLPFFMSTNLSVSQSSKLKQVCMYVSGF